MVTAPSIGLLLLALAQALGYASGARVSLRFTRVVARNFLWSAGLAGVDLDAGPGQARERKRWAASRSAAAVVSQPRQASVMDTPYLDVYKRQLRPCAGRAGAH